MSTYSYEHLQLSHLHLTVHVFLVTGSWADLPLPENWNQPLNVLRWGQDTVDPSRRINSERIWPAVFTATIVTAWALQSNTEWGSKCEDVDGAV